MLNGGIIGPPNSPTASVASGIWGLDEEYSSMKTYSWPDRPIASGLILYLDAAIKGSYPGTGSTWSDLSGNSNHATLYNSPGYGTYNGHNYLTFNESNQYGQLPAGMANFTGGMTICGLLNWGNAGGWERMIDFGNGSANNNILVARSSTTNDFRCEIYSGSSLGFGHTWTGGITNNTWGFFCWSVNGSTSILGINNSYASTATSVLPVNTSRSTNYIGRSNWADAYFGTGMEALLVYNRGLTQDELTRNYNVFRGRLGV